MRDVLAGNALDIEVIDYAFQHDRIVVTCNRDDFLQLAHDRPHRGVVVVIRRRTRAAERAALLRLVERAGFQGLSGNITFA